MGRARRNFEFNRYASAQVSFRPFFNGPLAQLNTFYWKYRHLFIPGLLCAMVSAVFQITVPIIVRQAVDSIPRFVSLHTLFGGTGVQGYLFGYFFAGLLIFGLIIIGLSLASGLFSFLTRRTVVVASRHIEFDLRNDLYDHLQKLPPSFYHEYSTGDVITRATNDIEHVRRYIGPAIMYATRAVTLVAAAMTVMFIISPRLTLYALLPMPLLAISVFFVSRMVHTRSEARQLQYSKLTSRVQEALAGIRVLKAYTREDAEQKAFEKESGEYRGRNLDLAMVDAIWRPAFVVLVGLSVLIVVFFGGRLAAAGVITIGNIAEYVLYVTIMTWPVASLGYVITMIQEGAASMERLETIFKTEPEIADGDRTDYSIQRLEGRISFENVSYQYTARADDAPAFEGNGMSAEDGEPGGRPVLRDVSFEAPAGATLGIVGRTGAGKSTLVELIPRLLEATRGTVRIDGRDIREIPLEVLRSGVGYVPQDVFLFSDTIAENIAFGVEEAENDAVEEAADKADLLANVRDFPEGFDTFVGERGITLSGGQKQRTSLARAFLRRPQILILDDALSAVDTDTEQRILRHLQQQFGRRTIVIVSHRLSAVQEADLIIVLEDGQVAEQGDHASLIELNGLYASLYRKQLLEEELEAL